MSFRVVIDSCGELTDEMKKSGNFVSAPLTLQVDEYIVQDDEEHFNQAEFLKKVAECPNCPKSSCPSPEIYRDAYDCDADHVYAVTLSEKLSGSYNSAVLGKNLYLEDHPDAKVYVFNSCSASVGETLIGLKIQELEERGLSFEEVVEQTEAYILSQDTWFVLENLDTLRKNGRLGGSDCIEDQTGHGINRRRHDYSAGSGKRHEESSCKNGRFNRGEKIIRSTGAYGWDRSL